VKILEKFLLIAVFLAFAGLTAWLESRHENPTAEKETAQRADEQPDYYIENFIATGVDSEGRQYVMEGVRLAHFPIDDTSLIEQPHIIQYTEGAGPRHVYAETGLISADGTEILLRGSVKVIESQSDGQPGSVTSTDRMRIQLRKKVGS
jgi:lipopolysaccharide export system protein LptC